jgi:hypothetical protein
VRTEFEEEVEMLSADRGTDHELGYQDGLRLVASQPIGHVALVFEGRPTTFPVHHHVVDVNTIVFRHDEVSRVAAPGTGAAMSLEVEARDEAGELWSVTASGLGFEVVDSTEITRLDELGLEPHGAHTRWIEMRPERVMGRRLPSFDDERLA